MAKRVVKGIQRPPKFIFGILTKTLSRGRVGGRTRGLQKIAVGAEKSQLFKVVEGDCMKCLFLLGGGTVNSRGAVIPQLCRSWHSR